MTITHNGREIELTLTGDGPGELYIDEAHFTDNGDEVSDSDIDLIMTVYASEISSEWYQGQVMAAEYAFEGDR